MGACCCPSNLAEVTIAEEPAEGRKCGPYEMREMLGRGSQAKVWLCTSENIEGQLFAAKVMKKRSLIKRHHKKKLGKYGKATGKIAREIAIMKRLRHEHVVNLFDVLDDPNQNFLVMVLEYMPGGTWCSSAKRENFNHNTFHVSIMSLKLHTLECYENSDTKQVQ